MLKFTEQELLKYFVNRNDCFATQKSDGSYFPINEPLTLSYIRLHLQGIITIATYCLNTENKVKWIGVDIDIGSSLEELKLSLEHANKVASLFPEYMVVKEFSGRRGFHVWIVFKERMSASYARLLVITRLNMAQLSHYEVFPKQTELGEHLKYGNHLKLPCGKHRVSGNFTQILSVTNKYE